ncbi:MAG: hypothetical protein ACYDC1_02770 [Limisphaerales bacterium]
MNLSLRDPAFVARLTGGTVPPPVGPPYPGDLLAHWSAESVSLADGSPVDAVPDGSGNGNGLGWNHGYADAYPYTDGNGYVTFGSTDRKAVGNPGLSLNAWRRHGFTAAPGAWTLELDHGQVHTTATNTVGWLGAGIKAMVGLSYWSGGGAPTQPPPTGSGAVFGFSGLIAEMLFYSRALSVGERAVVDGYLKGRYGL